MNRVCCLSAWVSLFLTGWGGLGNIAAAQAYQVPEADNNGDFNSAILWGSRGFYPNHHWVVVATDGNDPLNCRYSPGGEIRTQWSPGVALTAKFGGPLNQPGDLSRPNHFNDAVVFHEGRPWLRVTGDGPGLIHWVTEVETANGFERRIEPVGECYVRANSRYITPVRNGLVNREQ